MKKTHIPKSWDDMTSSQKDIFMKENVDKDNFNDFAKKIEKHHFKNKWL